MTHQEGIARCISLILQDSQALRRVLAQGNVLDALIRSFDERHSDGTLIHKTRTAYLHYRMTEAAFKLAQSGKGWMGLSYKRTVPIKDTKQRLLKSDGSFEQVLNILQEAEIIYLTRHEERFVVSLVRAQKTKAVAFLELVKNVGKLVSHRPAALPDRSNHG